MGLGTYRIMGGEPLNGEMHVVGGKNAVLPILAAAVLNAGVSVLRNCPRISDTHTAVAILRAIGCHADFDGHEILVDSAFADTSEVPEALVREMRAAIIFLGSMLGRFGKVCIGYPGGCELGARPIDLHLKALRRMGATITEANGFICAEAARLHGARVHLDFPSVGATENIMLAAVLAEGETVICNAAREPEIVDLQGFLNAMGAKVCGAGTDTVTIEGVAVLRPVEYTVMPDRIVAGTMLVAAAMTRGEIILRDVVPGHLTAVLSRLAETGCTVRECDGGTGLYLRAAEAIQPVDCIRTLPHPGFPTDMQSQFMAYLCLANGTSIFTETVFESRNKHVGELRRMGADIVLSQDGQTAIIRGLGTGVGRGGNGAGKSRSLALRGAVVEARDLRGGAALVLAGLAAEGETVVLNTSHIERGYEAFDRNLAALGARIAVEVDVEK